MSAATNPLHSHPPQASASSDNSPLTSKVNYLQRCVENISSQTEKYHSLRKNLRYAAAVVSTVVFVAAVIVSIAACAIFSPSMIPVVSFGILAITSTVQNFIKGQVNEAQQHAHKIKMCNDIRNIEQSLPKYSPLVEQNLARVGVLKTTIQNSQVQQDLSILNPVLAHYQYWHNLSEELSKKHLEELAKHDEHVRTFPLEHEQIRDIRLACLARKEEALVAKTNAAFYLHILKNPDFTNDYDEIVAFDSLIQGVDPLSDHLKLGARALAAQFNDPKQDNFVVIKGLSNENVLTRQQLLSMNEAQIAAYFIA
jgi:hypothetical protein